MKKPFLLFIFLLFFIFNVKGQNLVPNGGFEQFIGCPDFMSQFDSVSYWMNPTGGTPDYFNSCNTGVVNVPNSLYGYQQAHSGSARCGLYVYNGGVGGNDLREYIQIELDTTLSGSQCYYFEMYVSLADNFKYMSDAIGVYFSDTAITGVPGYPVLPYVSQITNTTGNFDSLSWRLVSGTHTANGGESHIIIGNFKDDANTNYTLYNPSGTYSNAYLYIDDVSLSPCTATEEQNQNEAIKIYPNPVKELLAISYKLTGKEKAEIIITDILGKEILRKQFSNSKFQIPTSNFQSGIYFVEINDGKNILRKKFLKE